MIHPYSRQPQIEHCLERQPASLSRQWSFTTLSQQFLCCSQVSKTNLFGIQSEIEAIVIVCQDHNENRFQYYLQARINQSPNTFVNSLVGIVLHNQKCRHNAHTKETRHCMTSLHFVIPLTGNMSLNMPRMAKFTLRLWDKQVNK